MIEKKVDRFHYYDTRVGMEQTKIDSKELTDLRFNYFIPILDYTEDMQTAERQTNYMIKKLWRKDE